MRHTAQQWCMEFEELAVFVDRVDDEILILLATLDQLLLILIRSDLAVHHAHVRQNLNYD